MEDVEGNVRAAIGNTGTTLSRVKDPTNVAPRKEHPAVRRLSSGCRATSDMAIEGDLAAAARELRGTDCRFTLPGTTGTPPRVSAVTRPRPLVLYLLRGRNGRG
jgi:hypothetical protein